MKKLLAIVSMCVLLGTARAQFVIHVGVNNSPDVTITIDPNGTITGETWGGIDVFNGAVPDWMVPDGANDEDTVGDDVNGGDGYNIPQQQTEAGVAIGLSLAKMYLKMLAELVAEVLEEVGDAWDALVDYLTSSDAKKGG